MPASLSTRRSSAFAALGAEDPLLSAQVYRNIGVHLSQQLRAAAWAWRAATS